MQTPSNNYITLLQTLCIQNASFDSYIALLERNKTTLKKPFVTQAHHAVPVAYYKVLYNCCSRKAALRIANSDPQNCKVNMTYADHLLAHKYLAECINKALYQGQLYYHCLNALLFAIKHPLSDLDPECLEEVLPQLNELYLERNLLHSAVMKNYYAQPEHRTANKLRVQAFWDSERGTLEKKAQSLRATEQFADPAARQYMSTAVRKTMNTEAFKKHASEVHKRESLSAESLAHMQAANKKNWQDPAYRNKLVEAHIHNGVRCIETGQEFHSTNEAAIYYFGKFTANNRFKISRSTLDHSAVCVGDKKYHFEKVFYDDTNTST